MSLLEFFFGRSFQPQPFDESFGSFDHHFPEMRSFLKSLESPPKPVSPKLPEAIAFWSASMRNLAERHARSVAKLPLFDMSSGYFKSKMEEIDKMLAGAHHLLLQQSDTRWSESITNDALRALEIDAHHFRFRAS